MEGRVFENFQKNQNSFKIPKMPKIVPKSVQTKIFKVKKKIQNSKKAQKTFSKASKRVLSRFRVTFSRKFFAQCSMEGRVFENFQKNQKSFKIPKMLKIVPKKVQTKIFKVKKFFKIPKSPKSFPKVSKRVLNMFWGDFLEKIFCPVCSMEGRVFENFQKNQKSFKIPNMPKIVPKSVQTCFEDVLG